MKKPKLGQKIYVVYLHSEYYGYGEIREFEVGYRGLNEFVVSETLDIYSYADYGRIWFASLKAAKTFAKKKYGANVFHEHEYCDWITEWEEAK